MRFLYKEIYITQERPHAISGFEFIFSVHVKYRIC